MKKVLFAVLAFAAVALVACGGDDNLYDVISAGSGSGDGSGDDGDGGSSSSDCTCKVVGIGTSIPADLSGGMTCSSFEDYYNDMVEEAGAGTRIECSEN